jgi:hypothetical protein
MKTVITNMDLADTWLLLQQQKIYLVTEPVYYLVTEPV